ncbi:MAG: hypothetical protein JWO36_2037 [Myxococcales bacterium]|nr:hypothetical protein [Myxococcales bacterium]
MQMRLLVLCLLFPASFAAAEPRTFVFRYLHVGRALGHYDLTTYTLRIDGAAADLTVEHAVTDPKHPPDQLGPYLPDRVDHFTGTAETTKGGLDLAFDDASDEFRSLSCHTKALQIARADALRVRTPGEHSECDGDHGVWSPAKTTAARVLSCRADDTLVFAPTPGIERAGLSEECYIQGVGLRAIRADGKIMRVSPKDR